VLVGSNPAKANRNILRGGYRSAQGGSGFEEDRDYRAGLINNPGETVTHNAPPRASQPPLSGSASPTVHIIHSYRQLLYAIVCEPCGFHFNWPMTY